MSLTIEPGVTVIGEGNFKITVDQSLLTAIGTPEAPITFTATDDVVGWRGMRLEEADDATEIRHCVFEYARGTGDWPGVRGGAMMITSCSPTVAECLFQYNSSHNANYNGCGGAICTEFSDALIENNTIIFNTADSGAGIATTEYGTPIIRGNVITDNEVEYAGGGMYLGARSSPLIEYNLIMRNNAESTVFGGGGINSWTSYIYYGTFATIRNNVIAYNSANTGGGIYCRYDRAVLENNVFVDNSATEGGGIYVLNFPGQAPLVSNCIVWGNSASSSGPQVFLYGGTGSAVSITYSDVEGGWAGTGNIDEDPLFVDADGGDDTPGTNDDNYRLTAGSPCIDAGNNAVVDSDVLYDMDGLPRIVDGNNDGTATVDMGPFEYQPEGADCEGDANGDDMVDPLDSGYVLSRFGCSVGTGDADCDAADQNGDGIVDPLDVGFVLARFGDCK